MAPADVRVVMLGVEVDIGNHETLEDAIAAPASIAASCVEVSAHQGELAGFDGDVGAGAYGQAELGLGEGGRRR